MLPIKENFVIDDKSNLISVIISKSDYDKLIDYIEELEDIAAYDKAKGKKGPNVSWEKIKR